MADVSALPAQRNSLFLCRSLTAGHKLAFHFSPLPAVSLGDDDLQAFLSTAEWNALTAFRDKACSIQSSPMNTPLTSRLSFVSKAALFIPSGLSSSTPAASGHVEHIQIVPPATFAESEV